MPSVFCFYSRSPQRQSLITQKHCLPEQSYLLYGADRFHAYGWCPENNLTHPPSPKTHILGEYISRILFRLKGYGGDFATVLANLRYANRADVVFSTVDTVGIPLALLRYLRILRRPLVYMSIGLVERLDNMSDGPLKRLQIRSLRSCSVIAGYGHKEVVQLQARIGDGPQYHFVPYGVDTSYLDIDPLVQGRPVDVLSAGMDIQRDFYVLAVFARRNPAARIKVVTSEQECQKLQNLPPNVECSGPIPFHQLMQEVAAAKVVALPVKENGYSGGTTSLLQAMALGKPVVVSETGAIAGGYGFVDRQHLRFVQPGNALQFAIAIEELLADPKETDLLARRGMDFVKEQHHWDRFVNDLVALLGLATSGQSDKI